MRSLDSGPVVVGATGGSGTRAVARILRDAGLFLGTELNESEDAWKLGEYSDRWIDAYLSHSEAALPAEFEREMLADLEARLADHCAPLTPHVRPWGWKEPRAFTCSPSSIATSLLSASCILCATAATWRSPQTRTSSASTVTRRHPHRDSPPAVRSIALWAWINLEAARYGETELAERYLRVRTRPCALDRPTFARTILGFLELDSDPALARDIVVPPRSLGRWRTRDPALISELEAVAVGHWQLSGTNRGTPNAAGRVRRRGRC